VGGDSRCWAANLSVSFRPSVEQFPGLKLIRVAGTPFQRGLQHGQLLRHEIGSLRSTFYRKLIFGRGRLSGLATQAAIAPILLALHRHIPRELRQEMRGVAAGAGVPYWDILIFNCFDDMLHGLWLIPQAFERVPLLRSRFACSSFALLGKHTDDGRLLHGRNLDYEVANSFLDADGTVTAALKEHVVAIEYQPSRGVPFISVGWPGVIGVVTSLNAASLSLACLTSTHSGETVNGVPLPLLYRCISQYASSLEQAEVLIRQAPLTIGNNLLVASGREQQARLFELSPHRVEVRYPRDDVLVTTNHFIHDSMMPFQNGWVAQSSVDRHTRLGSLCAARSVDWRGAAEFLRDTVSLAEDGGLWSCLENPGTIYSSVVEPLGGQLWVRVNDLPDRPWVGLEPSWSQAPAAVGAAV
jgi:hypothetical protein